MAVVLRRRITAIFGQFVLSAVLSGSQEQGTSGVGNYAQKDSGQWAVDSDQWTVSRCGCRAVLLDAWGRLGDRAVVMAYQLGALAVPDAGDEWVTLMPGT